MTIKKTEELSEQELDQVTGGATEELFGAYNGGAAKTDGAKDQLTSKANPEGTAAFQYNPESLTRTVNSQSPKGK